MLNVLGTLARVLPAVVQIQTLSSAEAEISNLKETVDALETLVDDYDKEVIELCEALEQAKKNSLIQCLISRAQFGNTQPYSDELKLFAVTLAFYSSRAYDFVRNSFDKCLPHLKSVHRWFENVGGNPGFTAESFALLKERVAEDGKKGQQVICNIQFDSMSIKKLLEFDGKQTHGYVNLGLEEENDDDTKLATDCLVFQVVAMNSNWKLPIGYFSTAGMKGKDLANLVKIALRKLYDIGVWTPSITCDCPSDHICMFRELGACFDLQSGLFSLIPVILLNLSTSS